MIRQTLGLSVRKRYLLDKITNLSEDISIHLLYIFIFPEQHNTIKHWKKEIATKLNRLSKYTVKPNSSLLREQDYFEHLYNDLFENREEDLYKFSSIKIMTELALFDKNNIYSPYRKNIKTAPLSKWKKHIRDFYSDISRLLSKGDLSISTIYKLMNHHIYNNR